jgi:UDP-2-acetamido-2-deoxy-ribo-hexuluronate aminotransferase
MYGNPKGVLEVAKFARTHKLPLLEDCAQAHGASISGKMAGTIGEAGIFSFYPTKNLACFSDGGAVVTNSPSLAERIRFIRENGENKRFVIEKIGLTSNLDEIQSAVLSLRLRFLNKYNLMRKKLARQLSELLKNQPITLPEESINTNPVYHMFTILTSKRNQLKKFLADNAITTDIHYPLPLHLQPALKKLGYKKGDFPNAERVCNTILTLPMYPFLRESEVLIISKAISKFFATPK